MLANGQEPIPVNATIARHFRFALQAKLIAEKRGLRPFRGRMPLQDFIKNIFQPITEEVGSILPKSATHNILKQNPYVAYKVFQTLHAFTTEELTAGLEKTLVVDTELKTSQADAVSILEQLVYELCDNS